MDRFYKFKSEINNEDDIVQFMKWMYINDDKWIDNRLKPCIISNLMMSYTIIRGKDLNRIKPKDQIGIMWLFVESWYVENHLRLK